MLHGYVNKHKTQCDHSSRRSLYRIIGCLIMVLVGVPPLMHAKNFGQHGTIFEITERHLLKIMMAKLHAMQESGEMEQHKQKIITKVTQGIQRPLPVSGLQRAQEQRVSYFDPTLTIQEDILDHHSKVVVAKGTTVNPLDTVSWGKPLVFFDADDPDQLSWAMQYHQDAEFVLVKGAPLDLQSQLNKVVYFDQSGSLVQKFNIQALPAVVSQDGPRLKIEEVKL